MPILSTENQTEADEPVEVSLSAGGMSSALAFPGLPSKSAIQLGRRQAWYDIRSSLPLIVIDVASVLSALSIVATLDHSMSLGSIWIYATCAVGIIGMTLLFQHIHELYPACGIPSSVEFRRIVRSCLMVTAGIAVAILVHDPLVLFAWAGLAIFFLTLVVCMGIARPVGRRMLGKFDWWAQPLLIVGNARTAEQLFQRLIATRHEGLRPVGVVFDAWEHWDVARDTLDIPFIGPVVDLQSILFTTGATRLAVADHNQYSWHEIQRFRGIPHIMVPTNLWHHPIEKSRLAECDGRIELHCHSALTNPFALMAKRGMDLSLILLTLPVWLPILLLIALIIKVTDRGPAFYKQARVGRFRKPFYAIKFRSMVCNADERLREHLDSHPELQDEWNRTHKLQEDPRITRFGCFLRKTSLDELPQLVNVLSGDMSLVGPRPIIDSHDYDREYIHEHPEVFDMYQMVRPGVTGLWQISGRNLLPYKQRVSLDRFYLHNWSVSLDMYILWRTLKTALLREGAY